MDGLTEMCGNFLLALIANEKRLLIALICPANLFPAFITAELRWKRVVVANCHA
jgi:hypothetical protein